MCFTGDLNMVRFLALLECFDCSYIYSLEDYIEASLMLSTMLVNVYVNNYLFELVSFLYKI